MPATGLTLAAERSASGQHASSSRVGSRPFVVALAPRHGPTRWAPASAPRAWAVIPPPRRAASARSVKGGPGPAPRATPLDPSVSAKLLPMVESAMLAAFSGMAFTLFSTVGLDKYVGYFLPLPAVLASARQGALGAVRVVGTTVALLVLLQGPIRAAAFLFMHGILAAALGYAWSLRLKWAVLVPSVAVTRVIGMFGYLVLSGWVVRMDMIQLAVTNGETAADDAAAVPSSV